MARSPSAPQGVTARQHAFANIPRAEIQRSVFDRSCNLKTTFNAGYLVPIFCDEALPGDTMELRANSITRMATLLHPIMENVYVDFFFFAVPNRLVWDNWQKMNGEQRNPGDSISFLVPQVVAPAGGYAELSLYDYFGWPTKIAGYSASALWPRAYNLIWNEWFRDENLGFSLPTNTGDGPDNPADYVLVRRGKRHDYFTSCLPFTQKGTPVPLPLGTSAPVTGTIAGHATNAPSWAGSGGGTGSLTVASDPTHAGWTSGGGISGGSAAKWNNPQLLLTAATADLTAATAATINQIREAFQVQRLLERDARGGTRYTEIVRSHFGVTSDDARLQRPEYLGGGSVRMNINTVAATNSSTVVDAEVAIGQLGGYGVAASTSVGFRKSFTEHCVILGMCVVRADLNYQYGLERQFSRRTRYDFFWPAFAHLGEQAVLNKEIYLQNTAADNQVFGYQERYAEYRYKPSLITGRFRSNAATSLDSWHLAQEFSTLPVLNGLFILDAPPIDRVVAVSETVEPQFVMDAFFQFKHARPMPVFGVPGLIDHF